MADPRQIVKDFSIMGSTLKPMGNLNASTQINKLRSGQQLTLRRYPENPADKNAVLVMWGQFALGYLPRGLAAKIAPLMDAGVKVICRKAPNALYGVCQLAYIPPLPAPAPSVPLVPLPEGVTQEDLDTATEMPPLGDSRRPVEAEPEAQLLTVEEAEALPATEEVPHADEPTADPPEVA